jgi:uncharacterized membrane protein YccC
MLSPRTKMAIKTCVAVVIAYAIALHMDWEKPYWAAWTAFSIGLATRGEGSGWRPGVKVYTRA